MSELILTVGNIGSGKSTIASKFAKMGHAIVNMDTLQQMLSGGEYGAYDATKKDVYQATENSAIESALRAGISVVVDRTNMDRKRRARFIEIGKKYGAKIVGYDFGPGGTYNADRRKGECRGVPDKTWEEVAAFMARSYEKPIKDEGFDSIIEAPQKFKFHAFDFDGTIVENKFPAIGNIIDGTVEKINALFDDLSNIIIVWTCRSGDFERQMRDFLLKNNIPFDFINENPFFERGSRKIFAHTYYDDRNSTKLVLP